MLHFKSLEFSIWLSLYSADVLPDYTHRHKSGSSLFCVGNFVRQVGPRSAMLRPFKVESGDKRHPSRLRRAPAVYSVSRLSRLRSALRKGNCILRSTASSLVPRYGLSKRKKGFFRYRELKPIFAFWVWLDWNRRS